VNRSGLWGRFGLWFGFGFGFGLGLWGRFGNNHWLGFGFGFGLYYEFHFHLRFLGLRQVVELVLQIVDGILQGDIGALERGYALLERLQIIGYS